MAAVVIGSVYPVLHTYSAAFALFGRAAYQIHVVGQLLEVVFS